MKRKRQPGFFDIAERTAKLTQMVIRWSAWISRSSGKHSAPTLLVCTRRNAKAMRERNRLMSCSCSKCWCCNNCITCLMIGLNTRYATDSPSCAFWDYSLKIAYRKKRAIYADSAYRSQEKEAQLAAANIPSQIGGKGARNHPLPLTEEQKVEHRKIQSSRARVEHVFGAQAQMGGHIAPLACSVQRSRLA